MLAALDFSQLTGLFLSFGVVALLAVLGTLAALTLRSRLLKEPPAESFTLQDLRKMHARGELSDDEFNRMRGLILGKAASRAANSPEKSDAKQSDGDLGASDTCS